MMLAIYIRMAPRGARTTVMIKATPINIIMKKKSVSAPSAGSPEGALAASKIITGSARTRAKKIITRHYLLPEVP